MFWIESIDRVGKPQQQHQQKTLARDRERENKRAKTFSLWIPKTYFYFFSCFFLCSRALTHPRSLFRAASILAVSCILFGWCWAVLCHIYERISFSPVRPTKTFAANAKTKYANNATPLVYTFSNGMGMICFDFHFIKQAKCIVQTISALNKLNYISKILSHCVCLMWAKSAAQRMRNRRHPIVHRRCEADRKHSYMFFAPFCP